MTTDSRYSWTSFYMEFADKLLAFKDDRQALIATLQKAYEEIGMRLPTLDAAGAPTDIDPFTVFCLFSRGLTASKRRAIALGLGGAFGVDSPLLDDFADVPVLPSINTTFYDQASRDEADIERLWNAFEAALAYADQPTESTRAAFASAYDAVLRQRRVGWNITMGLFWIRPFAYLNLCSRDRWFFALPDTMPSDIRATVESLRDVPQAADYLELRDRVRSAMDSGGYEYKTFADLSVYAWRVSEEVNQRTKRAGKEKAVQAAALGDADVETTRSWLYAPGEGAAMWEDFYERGVMGLAWGELGDLNAYASKEDMRQRLLETRDDNTSQTNSARAVWQFANEIKPGDVIFVKKGRSEILGRGIVAGDYVYDPDGGHYPHVREVTWTHAGHWSLDKPLAMKTLTEVTDYPDFVARIEAFFEDSAEEASDAEDPAVSYPQYAKEDFLDEVYMDEAQYDALVGVLRAKKNIILQGAPGVGKTYAAKRLAYSMMGVKDASRVMMVQFHQSYSYEDFIEGYRPSTAGFELAKGAFYFFCKKASEDEDNDYFFIIDEINRGNLSKIFGELFMLIESDKRGSKLQLLYSRELFHVPSNVYIVGMMNTADRSLAMLDYALRRRFAFVELRPAFDSEGFGEYRASLDNPRFDALVRAVERLNQAIAADESLGEGFYIGHSYFCDMDADTCDATALSSIVEYELIPMLREYWFDEPAKVEEWARKLRGALR
ncbi:AAA family ATPase [Schaalia sp. HMT-877]|nr:ATPase family protein [Actinomyces sp. oral taxon 877 str. F0543]WLD79612.1 AAA family ATPase [Schaalia sp. HMT-877]